MELLRNSKIERQNFRKQKTESQTPQQQDEDQFLFKPENLGQSSLLIKEDRIVGSFKLEQISNKLKK